MIIFRPFTSLHCKLGMVISAVIAFKYLFYFTLRHSNVNISCISFHLFSIALRQYKRKVLAQHLDLLLPYLVWAGPRNNCKISHMLYVQTEHFEMQSLKSKTIYGYHKFWLLLGSNLFNLWSHLCAYCTHKSLTRSIINSRPNQVARKTSICICMSSWAPSFSR